MTYPTSALEDICRQLLDDWDLTPEQISNLAKDLPRECAGMADDQRKQAFAHEFEVAA